MPHQLIKWLFPVLMLALAACGSVATPEWAANVQETRVAQAATSEHLTSIVPTATPTITPSPTPTVTPSPTSVPPTETPAPTNTPAPTEVVTEEAAAEDPIAVALAAGDPANGQVIFNQLYTQVSFACATCHSITEDELRLIGPGLWNVAERAATRVEGQNAVEYIHNSIVNPQAYVVQAEPPYPENLMPQIYSQFLSEQDLNDVIAYLLTLRAE